MTQNTKLISIPSTLLLATPRGFCVGVKRAIDSLNKALQTYPKKTIYCYHQIVHNTHVVKEFTDKGVIFVNSIDEVPDENFLVFSAHGVSPEIRKKAAEKKLKVIDATCPYVNKTHLELKKYASEGFKVLYLGQANHDEVVGTTGEAPEAVMLIQNLEEAKNLSLPENQSVSLVSQTTLSFDDTQEVRSYLKEKFPHLVEPLKSDICQATQNRQNGVKQLIKEGAEVIIVLGSANSSNSQKLKKVALAENIPAYLVDEITEVDPSSLSHFKAIGLTAGASLPEIKINEAIQWFKNLGIQDIKEVSVADEKGLSLPPAL